MGKIFLLIVLLTGNTLLAQNARSWLTIQIQDVGSFEIPPTMEVRGGVYEKVTDAIKEYLKINYPTDVIIHPKGLNEYSNKLGVYGRIILQTQIFEVDDDPLELDFNIADISREDLLNIDNSLREISENETELFNEKTKNEAVKGDVKIIEWSRVKLEKVNGMSCFHAKYKRQLRSNPIVLVNTYYFFNYDRMHTFTLSYRLTEELYWKKDFERVVKSLSLIKR
jgi:hypothetical protein